MSKEEIIESVKEWIKLENEIKVLQNELKDRRKRKKELTMMLVETMKNNEIDCFDISDGNIIYTKNKVRSPLSKKYLLSCLNTYFNEHPDIEANEVTEFILENRNVKINEGIRYKSSK